MNAKLDRKPVIDETKLTLHSTITRLSVFDETKLYEADETDETKRNWRNETEETGFL